MKVVIAGKRAGFMSAARRRERNGWLIHSNDKCSAGEGGRGGGTPQIDGADISVSRSGKANYYSASAPARERGGVMELLAFRVNKFTPSHVGGFPPGGDACRVTWN